MISETCSFNSIHGINEAKITGDEVTLKMFDVQGIEKGEDYHYINTGSPHYNIYIDDVQALDLIPFARNIRYNDRFKAEGTNVNVIQEMDESNIMVRTYERGVEGETLSCGTGVTACAISQLIKHNKLRGAIKIQTKGGNLEVSVETIMTNVVKGIKLTGPAMFVFKGRMNV
jgi:diaminopimelate epimerase